MASSVCATAATAAAAATVTIAQTDGEYTAALTAAIVAAVEASHGPVFTIAIAGGSQPVLLAPALAAAGAALRPATWRVFFVDERCVPLDDAASNYGAAVGPLTAAGIARENIFAIDPSLEPAAAARDYASKLSSVFGFADPPIFDLVLLGMGDDGHVASLFPGHVGLDEQSAIVFSVTDSPKPPSARITLSIPVLSAAARVVFTVKGGGKAPVVRRLVAQADQTLPAGRVAARHVTWLLDAAAAAEL